MPHDPSKIEAALRMNYGHYFEESLIKEILRLAIVKDVQENDFIIEIGQAVEFMPLLINGVIKIMREDAQGDELLLYFLERGDTCTMTLTCCLKHAKSRIRAVAEAPATLLMIPNTKMEEWMLNYRGFLDFILSNYQNRMNELIEAVDTLAFMKMDERLLKYLKDKAMVLGSDIVFSTHQQIAIDMHTSRVVISRLLKALEKEGKISLSRNQIKLLFL